MPTPKLLLTLLTFGILCGSAVSADPIIQGYVFQIDKKTPIENVNIEIYSMVPGGQAYMIDSTTTDKSGFYKFDNLKAPDSYDILYSHSKQESDIVSCLAETGQQQIRKYLYLKGQKPKTVGDLQQRVQTAKRLTMLTLNSDKPGPALQQFRENIAYISDSNNFDDLLKELTGKLPAEKQQAMQKLIKNDFASMRESLKDLSK